MGKHRRTDKWGTSHPGWLQTRLIGRSTANTRELFRFLFEYVTSKKLTLTASDSGFEAIKSSATPVRFDADSCHTCQSPREGAMKE